MISTGNHTYIHMGIVFTQRVTPIYSSRPSIEGRLKWHWQLASTGFPLEIHYFGGETTTWIHFKFTLMSLRTNPSLVHLRCAYELELTNANAQQTQSKYNMGGQDYKSQQPRMRTMANERTHLSRRQKMVITQYHWAATVRYGWTPCFKKDRIPSFNRKSPHFKTPVTDSKLL